VARSLLPASRRRREEVGIAVEMECPLRHAVAGETRRDETGTLYWADSWALFVGISGLCSRDFFLTNARIWVRTLFPKYWRICISRFKLCIFMM
jgi:hypothetical protein